MRILVRSLRSLRDLQEAEGTVVYSDAAGTRDGSPVGQETWLNEWLETKISSENLPLPEDVLNAILQSAPVQSGEFSSTESVPALQPSTLLDEVSPCKASNSPEETRIEPPWCADARIKAEIADNGEMFQDVFQHVPEGSWCFRDAFDYGGHQEQSGRVAKFEYTAGINTLLQVPNTSRGPRTRADEDAALSSYPSIDWLWLMIDRTPFAQNFVPGGILSMNGHTVAVVFRRDDAYIPVLTVNALLANSYSGLDRRGLYDRHNVTGFVMTQKERNTLLHIKRLHRDTVYECSWDMSPAYIVRMTSIQMLFLHITKNTLKRYLAQHHPGRGSRQTLDCPFDPVLNPLPFLEHQKRMVEAEYRKSAAERRSAIMNTISVIVPPMTYF